MNTKTQIHQVYKLSNGLRVPSVTTILGILNKPALLDWAWRLGCEGIDYKAVRDQAGDIGTLAHYLIMCHLRGETPNTSEYSAQDIDKAENSLLKFWDWGKARKVKPILVETPLVSERYGYGGTVDFYGKVDDIRTLIDFKTGKGLYSEHFHQVATYRSLLVENDYEVEDCRILRIGRDEAEGFEERKLGNMEKHWRIFQSCLEIYNLQKEIRKEE